MEWMGSYVHYIQWKPKKKKKLKVTQRREEEALSSDEPYELKENIDDVVSMPLEGLQEEPTTTTQDGMPLANDIPMEQGWGRPHQKTKTKTKNFVLLLKRRQPMCHVDEPARQLNCSGMATQGRASIVDTALESSCLAHWNCIYSSIYICAQNCANKKKKRKERKREIQVLYILPHIQPEWHTGDAPRRGECKGAHWDPLFVHVYTRDCRIYSQLAISENPKSYTLPTVHKNTTTLYLLMWGIKHPPLPPLQKAISGLVPSIRYSKDPMTCWNFHWCSGLTMSVFVSGLYPVGRGVGAIVAFCISKCAKICFR